MRQRQRLIESTNRGFGHLGDEAAPLGVRHEVEDRLIEVLDHCIVGPNPGLLCVNVRPFREFLWSYGQRAGWNPDNLALCLRSDEDCEGTLLFTVAKLKRMSHRHEWAINELMRRGLPIGLIPEGKEYLGV